MSVPTKKSGIESLESFSKAGPHKYKSRKRVRGKWVYEYDEPKKPKRQKWIRPEKRVREKVAEGPGAQQSDVGEITDQVKAWAAENLDPSISLGMTQGEIVLEVPGKGKERHRFLLAEKLKLQKYLLGNFSHRKWVHTEFRGNKAWEVAGGSGEVRGVQAGIKTVLEPFEAAARMAGPDYWDAIQTGAPGGPARPREPIPFQDRDYFGHKEKYAKVKNFEVAVRKLEGGNYGVRINERDVGEAPDEKSAIRLAEERLYPRIQAATAPNREGTLRDPSDMDVIERGREVGDLSRVVNFLRHRRTPTAEEKKIIDFNLARIKALEAANAADRAMPEGTDLDEVFVPLESMSENQRKEFLSRPPRPGTSAARRSRQVGASNARTKLENRRRVRPLIAARKEREAAGETPGGDVSKIQPGDRVYDSHDGRWSNFIKVEASGIEGKEDRVTMYDSDGVPRHTPVSWVGLIDDNGEFIPLGEESPGGSFAAWTVWPEAKLPAPPDSESIHSPESRKVTETPWKATPEEYVRNAGGHIMPAHEKEDIGYTKLLSGENKAKFLPVLQAERDAAIQHKADYRAKVYDAYKAGKFTLADEGVTLEAKDAVKREKRDRGDSDQPVTVQPAGPREPGYEIPKPPGDPTAEWKAEALAKPWTTEASRYQTALGVPQPWAGEISGTQLSRMSGAARRRYDKKRTAEWQASADAKTEWRTKVFEAYNAGKFDLDDPDVSEEAKSAVRGAVASKEKADQEAEYYRLRREATIFSPTEVEVGDRVYDGLAGRYVTVVKRFKASIRVKNSDGAEYSRKAHLFDFASHADIKAAAESGGSVRPRPAPEAKAEVKPQPDQVEPEGEAHTAGDVLEGRAPYGPGDALLPDHNSPETAYVIDDYPYGRRQRTQKRVWIETTKRGQRAVSQTKNPKTGRWNKPKSSTYDDLKAFYMDDNGHIQVAGVDLDRVDEVYDFVSRFPETYAALDYDTKRSVDLVTREAVWRKEQKAQGKPTEPKQTVTTGFSTETPRTEVIDPNEGAGESVLPAQEAVPEEATAAGDVEPAELQVVGEKQKKISDGPKGEQLSLFKGGRRMSGIESLENFAKGESLEKAIRIGKRGGKIIGTTGSGKPIYESATDKDKHKHLTSWEHKEAARHHRRSRKAIYARSAARLSRRGDPVIGRAEAERELTDDERKKLAHHKKQETAHKEYAKSMTALEDLDNLSKGGGPYIGPKGGKWADPEHKIPYVEGGKPDPKAKAVHAERKMKAAGEAFGRESRKVVTDHMIRKEQEAWDKKHGKKDPKGKKGVFGHPARPENVKHLSDDEYHTKRTEAHRELQEKYGRQLEHHPDVKTARDRYYQRRSDVEPGAKRPKEKKLSKGGPPYVGANGGRWADEGHTRPWRETWSSYAEGKKAFDTCWPDGKELNVHEKEHRAADVRRLEELKKREPVKKSGLELLDDLVKAGPYIGPKGGKWADAKHTVPWHEHLENQARNHKGPGMNDDIYTKIDVTHQVRQKVLKDAQKKWDEKHGKKGRDPEGKKGIFGHPKRPTKYSEANEGKSDKKRGKIYLQTRARMEEKHGEELINHPEVKAARKIFNQHQDEKEAKWNEARKEKKAHLKIHPPEKPKKLKGEEAEREARRRIQDQDFYGEGLSDWDDLDLTHMDDDDYQDLREQARKSEDVMGDEMSKSGLEVLEDFSKGGPYIGPKGGKWADSAHTIPWKSGKAASKQRKQAHGHTNDGWHSDHAETSSEQHKVLAERHSKMRSEATKKRDDRFDKTKPEESRLHDKLRDLEVQYHFNMMNAHNKAAQDKESNFGKNKINTSLTMAREAQRKIGHAKRKYEAYRDKFSGGKDGSGGAPSVADLEREKDRLRGRFLERWGDKNPDKLTGNDKAKHYMDWTAYKDASKKYEDAYREKYAKKSEEDMSALDDLAAFSGAQTNEDDMEKAQDIPKGKPSMGGSGGEQGGKLDGVGKTSGSGDSAAGPPINAPKSKKDKLSEDDADEDKQMTTHKKPIETAKKSLPQDQRDAVGLENAQAAARLRKGEADVEHGVGIPAPAPVQPEDVSKGMVFSQGGDALVGYSTGSDEAAAALAKGDDFYHDAAPSLTKSSVLIHDLKVCPACEVTMAKSLAVCPGCGAGAVSHRVMPGVTLGDNDGEPVVKSRPGHLRPAREVDLVLPNGTVSDDE